jgi:hypothetical protein
MGRITMALAIVLGVGISGLAVTTSPDGSTSLSANFASNAHAQWDDRRCRRLRRACEFKRELDQVGEGNCRRYRRECGRRWR